MKGPARMMTASETRRFRLSRLTFRIAAVGGLLFAASFVLPNWYPGGVQPSALVQTIQDQSASSQPPLESQIICFWAIPALLLPLVPATQAFRRTPHPAAAGIALLELLPTAGVLVVGATNTLRSGTTLSDLASYGSVGGEILGGFVLMVLGNLLALLALLTSG
jgi:hypothetical protein